MAIARYEGNDVVYVEFIMKENAYALFDRDGDLITILSYQEYLHQPQLQTIGNSNGRYRKSNSSLRGGSPGQSSHPFSSRTYIHPGSHAYITFIATFPPTAKETNESIHDAGIRAGEITAYRCWWQTNSNQLFSVYKTEYEWFPDVPMTGDVYAGVGVHAYKTRREMNEYGCEVLNHVSTDRHTRLISGTVALWGDIVEHERGYRAQYAKILSFDMIAKDSILCKRYGVQR